MNLISFLGWWTIRARASRTTGTPRTTRSTGTTRPTRKLWSKWWFFKCKYNFYHTITRPVSLHYYNQGYEIRPGQLNLIGKDRTPNIGNPGPNAGERPFVLQNGNLWPVRHFCVHSLACFWFLCAVIWFFLFLRINSTVSSLKNILGTSWTSRTERC